jgi:hypothetical protein
MSVHLMNESMTFKTWEIDRVGYRRPLSSVAAASTKEKAALPDAASFVIECCVCKKEADAAGDRDTRNGQWSRRKRRRC